jgi:hypothetical protein
MESWNIVGYYSWECNKLPTSHPKHELHHFAEGFVEFVEGNEENMME